MNAAIRLLSVCVLAGQAAAQTQFEALDRAQIKLQAFGRTFAVGDVDGDGGLDVMIYDFGLPGLRVFLNGGDGDFKEDLRSRHLQIGPQILVDVDLDGDLDALGRLGSGTNLGPPIQLILNDGTGRFSDGNANLPAVTQGPRESPSGVAAADIDGDGDPDLVVGRRDFLLGQATGALDILLVNMGGGFFRDASFQLPAIAKNTAGLCFADIDRDGDPDLVVANFQQQNDVYLNDGTGTFWDVTKSALPPDVSPSLAVAANDLDGDGDVDLVFASGHDNQFLAPRRPPTNNLLYLNDGAGIFRDATASNFPPDDFDSVSVDIADVDLDGDLDVAFGNSNSLSPLSDDETLLLYLNDGRGAFIDGSRSRLPRACIGSCSIRYGTLQVLFGDLDSDGDPDLVQANYDNGVALFWCMHRHVYAPAAATPGKAYELRFYSEPGYATAPVVAHAAVSAGAAMIPAPPFGIILLDPRSAIPLGSIAVPPTEGIAKLRFPIPPDPRLVGRTFYFQALIAQGGSVLQWRLTNVWAEQVR